MGEAPVFETTLAVLPSKNFSRDPSVWDYLVPPPKKKSTKKNGWGTSFWDYLGGSSLKKFLKRSQCLRLSWGCEVRLGLPIAVFSCLLPSQKATNKTNFFIPYGIPATTKQTETKHMAFQPPPYRNKTHGFPATTLQKQNAWLSSHRPTETKHMAFQPSLPETQAFLPKRYGRSLWKMPA